VKPVYAWVVSALSVGLAAGLGHEHFLGGHDMAVACRPDARAMAETGLVFGMSRPDGTIIAETDWTGFLDAEVTPRFPDGLTVVRSYGQWRGASGAIAKEDSIMLLLWYPAGDDRSADIDAIRTAYTQRFDQESVMRIDETSCVSF
jgi:hypothetical protein